MKRVDFDPNGERIPGNRDISGYERISWEEALDIVSGEIKRVKTEHGPGAVFNAHTSHHTRGNIGCGQSARARFMNIVGATKTLMNPDSWGRLALGRRPSLRPHAPQRRAGILRHR